jgi:hypothetical protein
VRNPGLVDVSELIALQEGDPHRYQFTIDQVGLTAGQALSLISLQGRIEAGRFRV